VGVENALSATSTLQEKVDKDQAFVLLALTIILFFVGWVVRCYLQYRPKNLESLRKWTHNDKKLQEKIKNKIQRQENRKTKKRS